MLRECVGRKIETVPRGAPTLGRKALCGAVNIVELAELEFLDGDGKEIDSSKWTWYSAITYPKLKLPLDKDGKLSADEEKGVEKKNLAAAAGDHDMATAWINLEGGSLLIDRGEAEKKHDVIDQVKVCTGKETAAKQHPACSAQRWCARRAWAPAAQLFIILQKILLTNR